MIKIGDVVCVQLVVRRIIEDKDGLSYELIRTDKAFMESITVKASAIAMKVTGEEVCCGEDLCKS